MHPTAAALYEAHVEHVMAQLQGAELEKLVHEESGYIWDRLETVKLSDVLSREEILEFQQRNFEHRRKMSDPAKSYARSLRDAVIEHLRTSDATLGKSIDKKDYDRLVKEVAGLRKLRYALIHSVVSNPLYGEIIANILADGIKSFTSEEGLAGKIPGASSFFKMGGGLLGGLQDSIDKNVRKFISENIHKLTKQSERFIQDLIDDRKVAELGQKLWLRVADKPVSDAVSRLDASEFDGFEPIVEDLVNQAVRSPLARDLNEFVIDHFLAENGGKSLQQLLTDIEIGKEDVQRESVEFFSKVSEVAIADGSLEARVRKHLEAFYASKAVTGILG